MTAHAPPPRRLLSRLSLRTRVTLLVAVAVGLAVALTSCAAYLTVRHELRNHLDTTLVDRARSATRGPLVNPRNVRDIPSSALGAGDVQIAFLYDTGEYVRAQGPVRAPVIGRQELAVANGFSPMSLRTVTSEGTTYREVAVPAEPGTALVFAQSVEPTEHELNHLGIVLLLVGGAGIVLAASAGLSIARGGLRPIYRLTAAAEHVARTEDLRPIAVEGDAEDELARLARTFNAMLAALAQSRQRQQQLVADAGHELRTPLTSLRTNLDLLAQSLRAGDAGLDPQERDALLADVRAQVEEMGDLVADLVELARESRPAADLREVDLAEVTERALERVRRRAPGVTFVTELGRWEVFGDADTLERAVTNLLDNAAKWSPPRGTVTVTLRGGDLRVTDEGPGISDADLPHVFERFYRATEARTLPGSGLGLAIVRQVVERHGGTVTAWRGQPYGTVMSARLPGHAGAGPVTRSSSEPLRLDSGSSQPRA